MGHEATLEGTLQYALSQPGGSLRIAAYLSFDLVHDGEVSLNLPDSLILSVD